MRSVVVVVVGAWACAARAATPAEDMVTTELLKLLDEEKSLMDDFGRRESFHDIFPAGTGAHLFQDGMGGPPPPPSFHIYKPATWGNIRAHVTSLLFAPKAHKAARGMRCCCHDIHTHCEDVHARATSSADFYKVTKCLADREASVGDLQPACAERIKTTIAGACNSELHSFCAGIEPGNKRLHACLLTNRKRLGNLCRTYIADVIPSDYLVDKSTRAGEPEKKVAVETARTDSPKTAGKAVAAASAKAQKVQKAQAKATKADIPNVRFSSMNEMSTSTGGKAKPLPSAGKPSATDATENGAAAVGGKQQPYGWIIVVLGALGMVALAVGVATWRSRRERETRAMYSSLMMVQPPAV